MTKSNTTLMMNDAFLLKPYGQSYLWGGTRLNTHYRQDLPLFPLAESWVCSVHPDGESTVASGVMAGRSLRAVLQEHPGFLGESIDKASGLPVLVKLIDAAEDLSVQVHPDDRYAREHENGSLGKTEFWYILEAEPGASIVYGFLNPTDPEIFRKALENGSAGKYLRHVPVKKGDAFFVKAGIVHAVGKGIVLAEVQESSNLTYRLYDYERVGENGKKRPLHIEKAFSVSDWTASEVEKKTLRRLSYKPGFASEMLCRCRYFQVERLLVNNRNKAAVTLPGDPVSFQILLCTEGSFTLTGPEVLKGNTGSCIFIPAFSHDYRLEGQGEFLLVRG